MDGKKRMNPQQKAVAVRYDPTDLAPKVMAKGAGYVAERILEKGQQANIPVYKDAKLAEELSRVELGEHIPPELYEVVAQVLIFISDLDKLEAYKRGRKQG